MKFLLLPLLLLLCINVSSQLWVQDFETNGLNTAYTSPSVFTTNLNGHYNRTNGSNISNTVAPYSNKHGNFVWAGENLNITGGAGDGLPNKTITFTAINVAGQTNLQFRGLFGSGNPSAGWDYDDILYVEYRMDAGLWTKILQFAANSTSSNAGLYHDADLNGIGEGAALQPSMQQFTANIPVTGASLQLRIYTSCTAQSEEFAFDYLRLYSTTTATPGCTDPNATNFNAAATVSNGSCAYNGCTNAQALNYNPLATTDDGSCVLSIPAVHINEIHFNPNEFLGFTDLTHEFVEIHNATNAAVNIAGWRISGGIDCVFPIGASIPANGFIVVASTPATYTGAGSGVYAFTDDLNNISENIRLYQSSNILVDQVTYYSNCWPTSADGNGPSLELINYSFDNNVASNYCTGSANNGTPGLQNSCYSSQIAGCTNPNASNYNPLANFNDGSCIIEGCTYASALNYDTAANTDNGTCQYAASLPGCTNSTASNYNPNATIDNGSCIYPVPLSGCTYANAINYNPLAQSDDGSCIYPQPNSGCTYAAALNYNSSATSDDGSCVFGSGIAGCTYTNALNFDNAATIDDGSCNFTLIVPGCTVASALNYNNQATFDDGSCVFQQPILGCMYASAINYNPLATQDAGNCQFPLSIPGCTNPDASNFNSAATIDNGSCIYPQLIEGCTYSTASNYNPLSQIDNGSCIFSVSQTLGCTYESALNFNANSTQDDGTCLFAVTVNGCTNSDALNYNPNATFDDGSCQYPLPIEGCTYTTATNYSAAATQDDGSCIFVTNPTTCPEDIDGNSTVGVSDLLLFIAAYGITCN
jgi:hypothetical protein